MALSVVLYTIVMAYDSLRTGLGHDDLMNLTNAWRSGLENLLYDNVKFYAIGSTHRPFGELCYWLMFRCFGFDPFPYRVGLLTLLGVNTGVLYGVCRSLDLPWDTAVMASFLFGYHYGLWALYYNTGTCYDVLACFFYLLALGLYVRLRKRGRLTWRGMAVFAVLLILSLNSKEMGVTLPFVLLVYELTCRGSSSKTARGWARDVAVSIGPACLIVALYSVGQFTGPKSFRNLDSYAPRFDPATYFEFLGRTFAEVFYSFEAPAWLVAGLGCAVALAVVACSKRRGPTVGVALFFVGVIPVAFIAPRSLSAAYIPLAGLAIVYGAGLTGLAHWAASLVGDPRRRLAYVALAAAAGCVVSLHLWVREHGRAAEMMAAQAEEIRAIRLRLRELVPDPAPGSRILLLQDPFLQTEDPWFKGWASVFLVELLYEDVHVDQAFRMNPPPDEQTIAGYDYVLTSANARLELARVQ